MSAELGFWIQVVSRIPDSLSCNPGFHISKAKICRIPESLTRASFITLINCVTSVSVWFRNKERPRNDEELDFRFWLRSLTLVPGYLLRNGMETLATQVSTLILQLVPDSFYTSLLFTTFFCFLADETGAADSSRRRYCGGITYNPSFKICCGGTVQLKFGTRPRCCGTKAYDTSIQMCCGRTSVQYKLYRMSPRCCGTRAYDTSYQMCCDGISVQFRFGSTPRCCGTKGYDARSKKCCKNWLGNKWVCGMGDADQPFISK